MLFIKLRFLFGNVPHKYVFALLKLQFVRLKLKAIETEIMSIKYNNFV